MVTDKYHVEDGLLGSRAKPDISLLALSKVLSLWQGHNSRIRKKRDNASRSLLPETRARVAPGVFG